MPPSIQLLSGNLLVWVENQMVTSEFVAKKKYSR
jgi:hypothetical protein